ncbi:MAG: DUF362 domain-containing protein [Eubacteriaceae bacterium]
MADKKSQVVLMPCESYDFNLVYQQLKKAIDLLGGIKKFVDPRERVLLKPNLLRGKSPEAGVTTHPVVFEAMIKLLREEGIQEIAYGDSPGFGSLSNVAKECGLKKIGEAYDVPLLDFSHGETVDYYAGEVTKRFEIAKGVLDSEAIINLPKMKTHGLTRLTGAVKNLFGCVYGFNKGASHARYPEVLGFSKMLIDLNRYLLPKARLHVMDGVIAMEGNGPASGTPVLMKVLIVSEDPVALDATFARMVDLNPEFMPTNVNGKEMGLGEWEEEKIELIGGTIDAFKNPEFDVVREPVDLLDISRLGALANIRGLLVRKPVVEKNKCVGCGICEKSCPLEKKAIKMVVRKRRTYPLYYYHRCIRCYCCQEMCPTGAISVKTPMIGKLLVYK